ncbi:hypothetical protein AB6A40_004176 [Gnathostoma spinigerum]|uniref:Uncharacterized protein n=1 Tax=Gnathostoma spinigerum TaxID=75299 RepID=A0ABD6ELM2_9BILA
MTTYRRRVERHACTMFAPEIRDSRTCGVCQRDVGEHARHAIPPVPSRSVQSTRVELASPDDLPRTALISPITKPFQPVQRLTNGFTPSQTSAFSEYDRLNASPSDVKSLRKNGTTSPQCQEALSDSEIIKGTILIKPQPRYALKPSNSATTTSHFRDITYASNKTTPVCSQVNQILE